MVGATAVLPTPKHREKDVSGSPVASDYEKPKSPGGMTAQRMQCFKTKRCRFWLESRCTRGDRCTYAHTDVELRIPPDLTKTKICTRWKRGTCDKSSGECAYAHGMEDLREAVTPSTTGTNTNRHSVLGEPLSFGVPPPSPSSAKLRDSPPHSSRSCQTISSTASTRYASRRGSDCSSAEAAKLGVKSTDNSSPIPISQSTAPRLPSATKPLVIVPPSHVVEELGEEISSESESEPDPRLSSTPFTGYYTPPSLPTPHCTTDELPMNSNRWTPEEVLLAVLTTPYYD